jgi:hypothetical protein
MFSGEFREGMSAEQPSAALRTGARGNFESKVARHPFLVRFPITRRLKALRVRENEHEDSTRPKIGNEGKVLKKLLSAQDVKDETVQDSGKESGMARLRTF